MSTRIHPAAHVGANVILGEGTTVGPGAVIEDGVQLGARNTIWANAFLGRSAAHPWGAMRAIGSFIGAGIMERYKSLRFGILESGRLAALLEPAAR